MSSGRGTDTKSIRSFTSFSKYATRPSIRPFQKLRLSARSQPLLRSATRFGLPTTGLASEKNAGSLNPSPQLPFTTRSMTGIEYLALTRGVTSDED